MASDRGSRRCVPTDARRGRQVISPSLSVTIRPAGSRVEQTGVRGPMRPGAGFQVTVMVDAAGIEPGPEPSKCPEDKDSEE